MKRAGLIALVLLTSCGAPSFPLPTDPFSGIWELTTVSGEAMPFTQPSATPAPGSRIRPGSAMRRGELGIYISPYDNNLSALQWCQEWTDAGGVQRREVIHERLYIRIFADSIRVDYPDRAGRPFDTGRLQASPTDLQLSQRIDGREFILRRVSHYNRPLSTCT